MSRRGFYGQGLERSRLRSHEPAPLASSSAAKTHSLESCRRKVVATNPSNAPAPLREFYSQSTGTPTLATLSLKTPRGPLPNRERAIVADRAQQRSRPAPSAAHPRFS